MMVPMKLQAILEKMEEWTSHTRQGQVVVHSEKPIGRQLGKSLVEVFMAMEEAEKRKMVVANGWVLVVQERRIPRIELSDFSGLPSTGGGFWKSIEIRMPEGHPIVTANVVASNINGMSCLDVSSTLKWRGHSSRYFFPVFTVMVVAEREL